MHEADTAPKVLPHSIEAEEYLLSCILLDGHPTLSIAINGGIKPESFYVPANRVIYDRMMKMLALAIPLDMATLSEELRAAKELDQVGGYPYLVQITGHMPTTAQVSFFITHVRDLYRLRMIIKHATRMIERCHDHKDGEIADTIADPLTQLLSLSSGEEAAKDEVWSDIVDQAEAAVDSMVESKGLPLDRIIKWPWSEMNEHFSPMERGELIIIGGRASTGKSTMACACLREAARAGLFCYFVTLEVKPYRVVLKMAQMISRIGIKILGKETHPEDVNAFRDVLKELRNLGIRMSSRDKRINQIEARARALKAQGKLDMMVVDYGGLIEDIVMAKDKEPMIGQIQKRLKRLADELDIVVIEPWQISRGMEKENNRTPRLSDLKGSGDLEADANRVILLHRPNEMPSELGGGEQSENSRISEVPSYYINVIQAKGRDHGTSSLSFWFRRDITEFFPVQKAEAGSDKDVQDDLPI